MKNPGILPSDEPPDGDFARYVESLVGGPPEDPEQAGRELSARLARREALRQQYLDSAEVSDPNEPLRSSPAEVMLSAPGEQTRRAIAEARRPSRGPAGGGIRRLASRVLIIIAIGLIGLPFLVERLDTTGPGFLALVIGIMIGQGGSKPRTRTGQGRP